MNRKPTCSGCGALKEHPLWAYCNACNKMKRTPTQAIEHNGFRNGDLVKTASGKIATLKRYRNGEAKWNAVYVGEPDHLGSTILDPRHIELAE